MKDGDAKDYEFVGRDRLVVELGCLIDLLDLFNTGRRGDALVFPLLARRAVIEAVKFRAGYLLKELGMGEPAPAKEQP